MKIFHLPINVVKNSINPFCFSQKAFFSILLIVVFTLVGYSQQAAPYITIWKSDNTGPTSDTQIKIPAFGAFDYTWEEVANPSHMGSGSGMDITLINFGSPGIYKVSMTPKDSNPFHRIQMTMGDSYKLLKIIQWGDIEWSSFEGAYGGTGNLEIIAIDIPNLSNVTNMAWAFQSSAISTVPNMNNWNTENVVNMQAMFALNSSFNQDIGNWNTENVVTMESMFSGASSFNQDIGSWNIENVTSLNSMFSFASSFNRDIGNWNTQNVTNFQQMFSNASSFNQDIGSWNTENADTMKNMFSNATSFNQNVGNWNTENVTTMEGMFSNATSFNQNIGGWSTQNLEYMDGMFVGASSFNQDIGGWNTQNVKSMKGVFRRATSFNQSLGNWSLSGLENPDNGAWWMLDDSGIDCENYSSTLKRWANNPNTPAGVSLGAIGMKFSPELEPYRNRLINDLGWNIEGDSVGFCALSVDFETKISVDIYPNPTKNLVYINGLKGSESIQIFDLNGRLLYSFSANTQEESLDMSGFASGIYFLRIEFKNQVRTTKKIIKD